MLLGKLIRIVLMVAVVAAQGWAFRAYAAEMATHLAMGTSAHAGHSHANATRCDEASAKARCVGAGHHHDASQPNDHVHCAECAVVVTGAPIPASAGQPMRNVQWIKFRQADGAAPTSTSPDLINPPPTPSI